MSVDAMRGYFVSAIETFSLSKDACNKIRVSRVEAHILYTLNFLKF